MNRLLAIKGAFRAVKGGICSPFARVLDNGTFPSFAEIGGAAAARHLQFARLLSVRGKLFSLQFWDFRWCLLIFLEKLHRKFWIKTERRATRLFDWARIFSLEGQRLFQWDLILLCSDVISVVVDVEQRLSKLYFWHNFYLRCYLSLNQTGSRLCSCYRIDSCFSSVVYIHFFNSLFSVALRRYLLHLLLRQRPHKRLKRSIRIRKSNLLVKSTAPRRQHPRRRWRRNPAAIPRGLAFGVDRFDADFVRTLLMVR